MNVNVDPTNKLMGIAMILQSSPPFVIWGLCVVTGLGGVIVWWLWSWWILIATIAFWLIMLLFTRMLADTFIKTFIGWKSMYLQQQILEEKLYAQQIKNNREEGKYKLETTIIPQILGVAMVQGHNFSYSSKGDIEIRDWRSNVHQLPETQPVPLLNGPHIPEGKILLSTLLDNGEMALGERDSLLGYGVEGPLRGKLFERSGCLVNSVYVCGEPDSGKSTLGVHFAILTLLAGGKLVVIDPQSELEQSLTNRLGPLARPPHLLCPVAGTPDQVALALQVINDQMKQNDGPPLLVLVDEFSVINSGYGEWSDVGADIYKACEQVAVAGRKIYKRVITFGQIPNATRSGGTEFRNVCSVAAFHMKEKSAQLLLPEEDRAVAATLRQGECVILDALGRTYHIKLPYPDDLARVDQMLRGSGSGETEFAYKDIPEPLEPEQWNREALFTRRMDAVRDLRSQGLHQGEIIEKVYGVSKGGSAGYRRARAEYEKIIEELSFE